MSDRDPYDGEVPDSIAGIADTGSMVANSTDAPSGYGKNAKKATPKKAAQGHQFKITAKRQGMLHDVAEKKYLESMRFIMLVREMGEAKLDKPFNEAKKADRDNGDFGPRGVYSALVLNTFLDGLATISAAGFKDPQNLNRALRQGKSLMNEIGMSADDIQEHLKQYTPEQLNAA